MTCLIVISWNQRSQAIEIFNPMPVKDVFDSISKGIAPSPGKLYSALDYINKIKDYKDITDPVLKDVLKERAMIQFGAGIAMNIFNTAIVEAMDKKGVFDKIDVPRLDTQTKRDLTKLWLDMCKNALMGNIPGAIIDTTSLTVGSWNEAKKIIASLPSDAPMDTETRYLYDLINGAELMKKEKPYLSPVLSIGVPVIGLAMAFADGVEIIEKEIYRGVKELFGFKTALAPTLDASQLAQRTAQDQLTPIKVTFTQTFNGLYTQTPIIPGSQIANFSGTITSGTRVGEGTVPGNFTGSFSGGLTVYPGDLPGTYNNQPFNAWSVGTVEAIGFKEGPLKGTMSITGILGGDTYKFPSGPVTINTDGSLSHTLNGVIKENGVGWGTTNGTLTQSKTTP